MCVQGCVEETKNPQVSSVVQKYSNATAAFREECLLLQRALMVQGRDLKSDWIKLYYSSPETKLPHRPHALTSAQLIYKSEGRQEKILNAIREG